MSKKWNWFYGLCISSGISAALYLWYHPPKSFKRPKRIFSREEILTIAKRFERDFYPVYKIVRKYSKILSEVKIQARRSEKNEIEEILNLEGVRRALDNLERSIFKRFNIKNGAEFKSQFQIFNQTDIEIKAISEKINRNMEIYANSDTKLLLKPYELPNFATPAKTYKITSQFMIKSLRALNEIFFQIETGNLMIDPRDQAEMRQLQKYLSPSKFKQEILENHVYGSNERFHEQQIFDSSLGYMKHSKSVWSQPLFRFKFVYHQIAQRHFSKDMNSAELALEIDCLEKASETVLTNYFRRAEILKQRISKIRKLALKGSKGGCKSWMFDFEGRKRNLSVISENTEASEGHWGADRDFEVGSQDSLVFERNPNNSLFS